MLKYNNAKGLQNVFSAENSVQLYSHLSTLLKEAVNSTLSHFLHFNR